MNSDLSPQEQAALESAIARRAPIVDARADANAVPLPGPALDAFLEEPVVVAGFTLRAVCASDAAILQRINHPIIQEAAEFSKPEGQRKPVKIELEHIFELLFLWSRPVATARTALWTAGVSPALSFREAALRATADLLPANTDYGEVALHLAAHYARAFRTSVAYQPRSPDGTEVFPAPSAPQTASAGGSTLSAESHAPLARSHEGSRTNGHSHSSGVTPPGQSKMIHSAQPKERVMAT